MNIISMNIRAIADRIAKRKAEKADLADQLRMAQEYEDLKRQIYVQLTPKLCLDSSAYKLYDNAKDLAYSFMRCKYGSRFTGEKKGGAK